MSPKEQELFEIGLTTLRELEVSTGILASGKEEIYGCIFGRDSLITILKLLNVYRKNNDPYLLELTKKVLAHLAGLQGKEVNIESGEEPGKMIHEFRVENHEHLTRHPEKPWYLYPDNTMRNFDSVDATPLFLMACYRYLEVSRDKEFIESLLPSIHLALEWILEYGDKNGDGFLDYAIHPDRKGGGLAAQSWMDSFETLFHEDGEPVTYPIAPVEVQSYAYAALRVWTLEFSETDPFFAMRLSQRATLLKSRFNKEYVMISENGDIHLIAALDGNGKPLLSTRSSMGHVLWANFTSATSGKAKCILKKKYVPGLVKRLLQPDLFEPEAGIRTLSQHSKNYQAMSYHNGSIWPHDNSLIIEGLERFDYKKEAAQVRRALLRALKHFQTPIELFVFEGEDYIDYMSPNGQMACKKQAWCAASMLSEALYAEPDLPLSPTVSS